MDWVRRDRQSGRSAGPSRRSGPANTKPGGSKDSTRANLPPRRTWLIFLLILALNYLLVLFVFPSPDEPLTVPYTVFKEQVTNGNVVAIFSKGEQIEGRFRKPVTYPPPPAGGGG